MTSRHTRSPSSMRLCAKSSTACDSSFLITSSCSVPSLFRTFRFRRRDLRHNARWNLSHVCSETRTVWPTSPVHVRTCLSSTLPFLWHSRDLSALQRVVELPSVLDGPVRTAERRRKRRSRVLPPSLHTRAGTPHVCGVDVTLEELNGLGFVLKESEILLAACAVARCPSFTRSVGIHSVSYDEKQSALR